MTDRLMLTIVQVQDEHKVTQALTAAGLRVTRLSSTGAFLGRRNVTLMIGLHHSQEDLALEVIHTHCHERVEYVSTPLEGAPLPIPLSTPIVVGGAIVFSFEVERFEEL